MTKKKTNIINLPTILTLIRVILVIPLFVLIFFDNLPAKILTLAFFIVASVTDFVDGYLARKNKQVTDLGAFLDPLADKMLVNLTFLALTSVGVHDKFLGEIRLSKQRKGIFVVGDVKTDMGIAAEYNRHPVCFAELQYLCVVCLG